MKHLLFLAVFLFSATFVNAQDDVISIVEEGIEYHDSGNFDKAIETYKKALEIDPRSPLVFYEIGLSYYSKGDYKTAIYYYDKVLKINTQHLLPATINKGLSLDNLGKSKAAFKHFKNAVDKFNDSPRIHYNLAYQYYNKNDPDSAIKHLIISIELDPSYATSHLLMGYLQFMKNNKIQSLLSYHYFLYLNPTSNRAGNIFNDIETIMGANVTVDENDPNSININISGDFKREFSASEMMLSLLAASNSMEENKDKTRVQLFIENTTTFFQHLGEMKENETDPKGIYWNFYIPFYYSLAHTEHMEAYYYHITENVKEGSPGWIEGHTMQMFAFEKWRNK